MRNLWIITILVIFGMSLWRASDRYIPAIAEPSVNAPPADLVEVETIQDIETQVVSEPVEEDPPAQAEPEQPIITSEPASMGSSSAAVNPRPKLKPAVQTVKLFNQVVIPTLKINTSIVEKNYSELSWDLSTLGQDVAQLGNIPNQTSNNNIVLAGHVTVFDGSNGPFRYLWKLAPGDQILLEDSDFIYTYTVREQILVYPDETAVLEDSQTPQLTLITCTTWHEETLSYLRRRVIVADLESMELKQVLAD